MSIDDETLMAFADGELPETRMAAVAAAVASDPSLAAKVARFRAVRTRLAGALDSLAPPADLLARAERAQAAKAAQPRVWGAAMAASVAGLVIGAGAMLGLQPGGGMGGDFRARGDLRAALDGVSSGETREGTTPLYTVIASDGRPCRAFRAGTPAEPYEGVACREDGTWRVLAIAAVAVPRGDSFSQASANAPEAVESALDGLSPGDPLSPEAERLLMTSGWTGSE